MLASTVIVYSMLQRYKLIFGGSLEEEVIDYE